MRRVGQMVGTISRDRNGLIKAIHARARSLQMAEDVRRAFQRNCVGKDSCKDMDLQELQRLAWALNQIGPRTSDVGRRRSGRDERQPEELASVEQSRMIQHLFDDLKIAGVGLARMNFCRRVCGRPWPQTRREANKIIEGLKAMRARGWRARSVERPGSGVSQEAHE